MKPRSMGKKQMPRLGNYGPEDYLMAAFDFPLRVCAWLAQMKAGMWVRNGMSLRHQAGTYKGVTQRDLSHHRDIFMLQTALVVCDPSRVLASIVDRYGMEKWVKGIFEQKAKAQDDIQHLDVVEDMIHLLIVLLSDRTSLIPTTENSEPPHFASMRRDLAHVLCFKPLSFSDICAKLPDKFQEQEDFHKILEEMTIFKYPEGVSDVGTFELKPQYVETIDPYMAYYNKNQRDEAELAWRKCVAKKTGQPVEDVVYEPNLRPIQSGVFAGLAAFTNTGMFAQIVYYSLLYPLVYSTLTPQVPSTRVETFLGVVLHLILIAIAEDKSDESEEQASFIALALTRQARSNWLPDAPHAKTIVALLNLLATKDEFKACHPKINLILRRMRQKRPKAFDSSYERLGLSVEGMGTASPAAAAIDEERERKKKAALERQARVLAQFQAQQKSFMEKQGDIDWGEMDDLEDEELPPMEEHRNFWKYPSGTCILCQEDTDERRLYGTFAYFTESTILRQTDFQDPDFVREAAATPENLDRSAEAIRPFGVARENKETIWKVDQHGNLFEAERSLIGKGFPAKLSRCGPVAVGCGHIMHFHCFEAYIEATIRRHQQQIARHAPEKPSKNEFICPLCKALGNAFLPIIWKGKEESYPGPLVPSTAFSSFLEQQLHSAYYTLGAMRPPDQTQNSFAAYTSQNLIGNLADKSSQLLAEAWLDFTPSQGGVAEAANDFLAILSPQDQTSSRGRAPDPASAMKELVKVYRRLKDTLVKNGIESRHDKSEVLGQDANELCGSDVLARAVGFSISAIEIQQRGVEAEYGMTFIERIPTQVLTQLRILAESVTSYIAVGGQRESGENRIDTEFRKDSERQHCQLFISQYIGEETEHARSPVEVYAPLLSQDLFIFLCECVFGVIPAQGFEIAHMVRLCYLAEITKVAYHLARNIPAAQWFQNMSRKDDMDPSVANFVAFCERLSQFDLEVSMVSGSGNDEPWSWENRAFQQPGLDTWNAWYSLLRKYALVFLRKCAVLLHVKYGVDFNSRVSPCPEQRELERLTEALRVPSLDEMLTALSPERGIQHGWPVETPLLVSGWVRHQATWPYNGDAEGLPQSAVLSHPGIFELIGLPKNYDRLIDECTNLQCPTNGGELTDPNICLFCGEIFCGQAVCCMKEVKQERRRVMRIGGGQQHMQK
jgi:E3 ubiquitin-protein ligase UBR1